MATVRCPECEIKIFPDNGAPTGRMTCPACGTIFERDAATGMYTVFYKEGEEELPEAPPEGTQAYSDAASRVGEEVPPEEAIANIGRK